MIKKCIFIINISLLIIINSFFISCKPSFIKEDDSIDREKKIFIEKLNDKFKYTYELAKILSIDQEIVSIYKDLKKKVTELSNINEQNRRIFISTGSRLKEIFERKMRIYEKEIILPVKYRFYLPPAVLWLKPELPIGEDIPLKDLQNDRPSLLEIGLTKKASEGFEYTNETLHYRVLFPIIDEENNYLGAVEVSSYIEDLMMSYLQDFPKRNILIFLNSDVSKKIHPDKRYLNNSILYYTNLNLESHEYETLFDLTIKNKEPIKYKNKTFFVVPINSIDNKNLGKILVSID